MEEDEGPRLFWWILPVLAFNLFFTQFLPTGYADDVGLPEWFILLEHGLRIFTLIAPYWLHEHPSAPRRARWFMVLAIGIYFASWMPVLEVEGASEQLVWALLPAITPALWLGGLVWLSRNWAYGLLSASFLTTHIVHQVWTF